MSIWDVFTENASGSTSLFELPQIKRRKTEADIEGTAMDHKRTENKDAVSETVFYRK